MGVVGDEFGGGECYQMVKGIKCILYKSGHDQFYIRRGTVEGYWD